jgi:hypothetical protein
VQALAKTHLYHKEKFLWGHVTLDMENNAVAKVNEQLAKERIPAVDDAKIRMRLRKALKDVQRG